MRARLLVAAALVLTALMATAAALAHSISHRGWGAALNAADPTVVAERRQGR